MERHLAILIVPVRSVGKCTIGVPSCYTCITTCPLPPFFLYRFLQWILTIMWRTVLGWINIYYILYIYLLVSNCGDFLIHWVDNECPWCSWGIVHSVGRAPCLGNLTSVCKLEKQKSPSDHVCIGLNCRCLELLMCSSPHYCQAGLLIHTATNSRSGIPHPGWEGIIARVWGRLGNEVL